jgi:site-specific DNA-methyltransferase (adenine-specific)
MNYQIIQGNNIDVLKTFPDNYFDSIVTDPPYGIDFLGKAWDANTGALETYQECLRVLKPGGHILAFSAARTYHHLAITLEQAGFEIRDQIMWIYSSGFPKSQDVGKSIQRGLGVKETKKLSPWENSTSRLSFDNAGEKLKDTPPSEQTVCTDPEAKAWEGWGTALKPAHEPIALARKPIKGSIKDNVLKLGVGALNIDATRVPMDPVEAAGYMEWMRKYPASTGSKAVFNNAHADAKGVEYIKDADAELNEDRNIENRAAGRFPSNVLGEIPDYQKYFYCPKVSRRERHIGFDTSVIPTDPSGKFDRTDEQQLNANERIENKGVKTYKEMIEDMGGHYLDTAGNTQDINLPSKDLWLPEDGYIKAHTLKDAYERWCLRHSKPLMKGNNHPTVKPIELMKYLIKLITPKGGVVLDPFNGSGSTGCAAVELGCEYVGIELDAKYVEIATKRIEAWNKEETTFKELFE